MKHYTYISNWKMNLTFDKTMELATKEYDNLVKLDASSHNTIVLCPSFESIYPLTQFFKQTDIVIGAQNCSAHISGSYTGQVSAQSLKNIGCQYCIIGHSETRQDLCETDTQIAHKCAHLLDYDITPIVCIGETKEAYDTKQSVDVIKAQLAPIISQLQARPVHSYIKPIIAYEPAWSIGTGAVADNAYLEMIFTAIQRMLREGTPNITWKMAYGGSVSDENISSLKKIGLIEGFLIGSASLDFQKMENIVQ